MASNYYNISINIRDRSGNISLIQDVYFPILFRYPWENTTDVLLVDSLAGLRGEALNRSIISGKVATTESILLYVGSRIERGFVLYEPIFVNNTLLGFAASIFRISSLIYDILGRLTPASVRILFFDQMDDAHRAAGDKYGDYLDALIRDDELNVWKLQVKDGVEIGDIHQSIDDEKVFNLEETLEVGDRSWTLVMYSTGDFLNDFQTSTPEVILSAGLVVTFALSVCLVLGIATNIVQQKIDGYIVLKQKRFTAKVCHEIRNPMNIVVCGLELSRAHFEDLRSIAPASVLHITAKIGKCIVQARTSGRHIEGILSNILDLAKLDEGKLELEPTATNVYDLVSQVVSEMEAANIFLDVCLWAQCDPEMWGLIDVRPLTQVLFNLGSNSLKHINSGFMKVAISEIESNCSCEDEDHINLLVRVRDSGSGISQKIQDTLFHEFTQAKGEKVGTGLGLCIAKKFVELFQRQCPNHGEGGILIRSPIGDDQEFEDDFRFAHGRQIENHQKDYPSHRVISPAHTNLIRDCLRRNSDDLLEEVEVKSQNADLPGSVSQSCASPRSNSTSSGGSRHTYTPGSPTTPSMKRSRLGKGSEFYFTMPMVLCKPVIVEPYNPEEDLRSLPRGFTTLLVDDESLNRKMLSQLLRKSMQTWECEEAATGEETIRMVKKHKHKFHVICLDENMETAGGEFKGSDTAFIIRSLEKSTSAHGIRALIICISGNCEKEDKEYYLRMGADLSWPKPIPSIGEIIRQIAEFARTTGWPKLKAQCCCRKCARMIGPTNVTRELRD
eukprot:874815_1